MVLEKKETLPQEQENETSATDEDEDEEQNIAGSLNVRNLHLMNRKAQRINHEKLENLFSNPHGIGLVHDYSGTSTLFNRQFPESLVMDDDFTKVMANEQKQRKTSTARPPCPRFHCVKSVQIRSFFWSAFSCIRTECRNTGKYGPERTPYLDTLPVVFVITYKKRFHRTNL